MATKKLLIKETFSNAGCCKRKKKEKEKEKEKEKKSLIAMY